MVHGPQSPYHQYPRLPPQKPWYAQPIVVITGVGCGGFLVLFLLITGLMSSCCFSGLKLPPSMDKSFGVTTSGESLSITLMARWTDENPEVQDFAIYWRQPHPTIPWLPFEREPLFHSVRYDRKRQALIHSFDEYIAKYNKYEHVTREYEVVTPEAIQAMAQEKLEGKGTTWILLTRHGAQMDVSRRRTKHQ